MRAREGGVSVRNVADVQGLVLAEVPSGGLLAVRGESAGWLEVEVPGGFAVWVSGRFLEPTEEPHVLRVLRNGVNMRPLPSTDENNYFLRRRLQAGDLVTFLELADPEAELAQTWARIWSPPGACGWVQAVRTEPLGEQENGANLWRAAEDALFRQAEQRGRPRPAGEPLTGVGAADAGAPAGVPATPLDALGAARALLAEERAKPTPDFDALRSAFRRVSEVDPEGTLRAQVELGLDTVQLLEERQRAEARLEAERSRQVQDLARRQERYWEQVGARDPLAGRFTQRGILVSQAQAAGPERFQILRGGKAVAEVICSSGRYDLAIFTGFDLGLHGRFEVPEAAAGPDALPTVDVARIEVLSRP